MNIQSDPIILFWTLRWHDDTTKNEKGLFNPIAMTNEKATRKWKVKNNKLSLATFTCNWNLQSMLSRQTTQEDTKHFHNNIRASSVNKQSKPGNWQASSVNYKYKYNQTRRQTGTKDKRAKGQKGKGRQQQ